MSAGSYYVYILASRHHGTIYIGVTNDIRARIDLHRSGRGSKFVQKYKVFRLGICDTAGSHCAREAAEILETRLEDQVDRARKS